MHTAYLCNHIVYHNPLPKSSRARLIPAKMRKKNTRRKHILQVLFIGYLQLCSLVNLISSSRVVKAMPTTVSAQP